MRILIVEDEKISRMYMTKIASLYGKCDIATDGEIAIELLKESFKNKKPYDVIFLDIVLPKLSGQIVLQVIRAYEKDIGVISEGRAKVIMTTALKDSKNIKIAYDNLVDGYIVKPILKEKLEDILKKVKINMDKR